MKPNKEHEHPSSDALSYHLEKHFQLHRHSQGQARDAAMRESNGVLVVAEDVTEQFGRRIVGHWPVEEIAGRYEHDAKPNDARDAAEQTYEVRWE